MKDYSIKIKIFKNENDVLGKYNLKKKGFITIQRGDPFSGTKEAPKMWPKKYYEQLIPQIKHKYPGIKIIQLGESMERCASISGVDLNLVGKTDWDDLKILLKNALYHIDGECGMVHLRKALKGGTSIVLFGPTPKEFFGYSDNINISTNECHHWCAALHSNWQKKCLIGTPICMYSITPKLVMDKINEFESHALHKEETIKDEIIKNQKLYLDPAWVDSFLKNTNIFAYETVRIPISELKIRKFMNNQWKILPLQESLALDYLNGDKNSYVKYINYKNERIHGDKYSVERFEELIKSFKDDSKISIIINPQNIILDGQHRACLLYKKNKNRQISVLKLYGDFE